MAGKKRAPAGRGDYDIGYGRTPLHTRYQKGKSGNPGGRAKSPPPAATGPRLDNPIDDAVLRVMDEKVRCEVAPGRWRRVPRSEAIVRELAARATYDPRSCKHLLELHRGAHRQQLKLREELEREHERRRQREIDEDLRREAIQLRLEDEKRRRRALRREEKMARERAATEAAQVAHAAELDMLCLAAKIEAALETGVGEAGGAGVGEAQADAAGAREAVADDRTYEDARLYETSNARLAAKPAARRIPEGAPTVGVSDDVGVETVRVQPTGPVRRRHSREPLIPSAMLCAGHGYAVAGQVSPARPRFS